MQAEILQKTAGTLAARVSLEVYGLEPLLKTVHKFTDKCYVHLEYIDAATVLCRFQTKRTIDDMASLAGEFLNEVLDQALRARLLEKTEPVRRLVLAQAFSRTNLLHPDLDEAAPGTESHATA